MKKKGLGMLLTIALLVASMMVPIVSVMAEGQTTLTIIHYQEQYQNQFDKLIELYAQVNPNVKLEIECIGSDYDKVLQPRVASGETPDVFMSSAFKKNELLASVSMDLTGQDFLGDVILSDEFYASSGALTAVPFSSQSWGILYNMDVFEAAGIETLPTTLDELKAVCETLKSAGVIPFAQGMKSDYVKKQFFGFTYAVDDNCIENIAALTNHETQLSDYDFIHKIFAFADVVRANCQENPYNDDFASAGALLGTGKCAMLVCGDWIVENAVKANPDAHIGIMAIPMSDDPADAKIYVTASTGLHVYNESKNVDEALAFLNWLVTSQEGKDWFSKDMNVLSSINGVQPDSQVALDSMIANMATV